MSTIIGRFHAHHLTTSDGRTDYLVHISRFTTAELRRALDDRRAKTRRHRKLIYAELLHRKQQRAA